MRVRKTIRTNYRKYKVLFCFFFDTFFYLNVNQRTLTTEERVYRSLFTQYWVPRFTQDASRYGLLLPVVGSPRQAGTIRAESGTAIDF